MMSLYKVWQCIGLGLEDPLGLGNVFQTGGIFFAQLTELCASQEKLEKPQNLFLVVPTAKTHLILVCGS